MLRIETTEGYLRINGEFPIPSAPAGEWSEERAELLAANIKKLVKDTVEAAELVDDALKAKVCTECLHIFTPAELAAEDAIKWGHPCYRNGKWRGEACESFRKSNL